MQSLSDFVNFGLNVNTPQCCCRGPRQDPGAEYTGEDNLVELPQSVILESDTAEFFPYAVYSRADVVEDGPHEDPC